jgi:hypothetical protein
MNLDFDGTPLPFPVLEDFVGPPTYDEWCMDQAAAQFYGEDE